LCSPGAELVQQSRCRSRWCRGAGAEVQVQRCRCRCRCRCRAVVHSRYRVGAEAEQVLSRHRGLEVLSRCRGAAVQRCRGAE
jgi:hypothetical protein